MHLEVEDGVTLHVEVLGEGRANDGPPVVMLHGLLVGNMATWYFTAAPALAARHKVVLFDLRGHGLSARARSGYDVATMTRDLSAVVERVAGAPAIVVGHSYGAVVAMNFAKAHPERVSKLVAVEAPLPPTELRELSDFLGRSPEEMLDALPALLRDAVISRKRSGRRFVESMSFLATESTLFTDLKRAEDFSDDELRAITCPTLAVYGTRSSCLPAGRRLARHSPRATLVELEGGHFLPMEAPTALSGALTGFIDG